MLASIILPTLLLLLSPVVRSIEQDTSVTPGTFVIKGDTAVSAQMLIALPQDDSVLIIDKTENNPTSINNHPAWTSLYQTSTNTADPLDVTTNTFCACGAFLPDGSVILVGGNNAVAPGGITVDSTTGNPYSNLNGGDVIRIYDPSSKKWDETKKTAGGARWYPTLEPLADGSVIIIGGCALGAYINAAYQDVPTIEYYPPRPSNVTYSPFLAAALPVNLYAITFLLPSNKLFMQAAYSTIIYDPDSNTQSQLPDMKYALRLYPFNAAVSMLPLTAANNYTVTIVFCGGTNLTMQQVGNDTGPMFPITQYPADKSCVRITPESANPTYEDDDDMLEGRVMGNFIALPDGKLLVLNGVATGTAGYSKVGYGDALPRSLEPDWVVGQSFGDNPIYSPAIYDPSAPRGSRWSRNNLSNSTIPRLYHSSASLLADGSVFVAGSNPNADVSNVTWGTEYRSERFYPSYYNEVRPAPSGLPEHLSYGGDAFKITLSVAHDLKNQPTAMIKNTTIVVVRPGFSTHALNFGARTIHLEYSYDGSKSEGEDGIFELHVAQLPPNAALFSPGPALMFVVINGVPSMGKWIRVGNGQIGTQPTAEKTVLPAIVEPNGSTANNGDNSSTTTTPKKSPAFLSSQPVFTSLASYLALSIIVISAAYAPF